MKRLLLLLAAFFLAAAGPASADAFRCEVLSVQGDVRVFGESGSVSTAKEGDLLAAGDSVEVPSDGSLDVAFDKDWKNVARIEPGTKAKIAEVAPAKIELAEGSVYAKLKSLPKSTSFDVQTPTALAAVRGTEYRTSVVDGKTEVFNFSPSRVYVYGVDPAGAPLNVPTVLEQDQKTGVESKGDSPAPPAPMKPEEKKSGEAAAKAIESGVERAAAAGRVGKVQSVAEIETALSASSSTMRYDEESRITDSRRRAFK